MKERNAVRLQLQRAGEGASKGALAVALTLSLCPTAALAQTEGAADSDATNTETAAPSSTEAETASTEQYTLSEDETATFAAASSYDLSKIVDGTYTGKATIPDNGGDPDSEDEWEGYDVTVEVTVANHAITEVKVTNTPPAESKSYQKKAAEGTKSKVGVPAQIVAKQTTDVDVVSTATFTSNAIMQAAEDALANAKTEEAVESEYTYGYAALTWEEYWSGEGVYNASDVSSSDEIDRDAGNGVVEHDKGGYDVVTRATANHGPARGAFQCTSVFHTTDGVDIPVLYWSDGTTFVCPDGTTGTFSKKAINYQGKDYTMSTYDLTGTRYVAVKVKTSELEAFKAQYQFVANGDTLYVGQQGSTAEGNMVPYSAVAEVNEDTNALKTVTKNGDSFSFSKATTGTNSGIKDQSQKTADLNAMSPDLKSGDAVGTFGEFLRVDFTGDGYGDLGANMQSVTWTYYGDDATRTNAVRTFGTKFAADNWMHSKMGIQLGLTDSARCEFPEGYDGTGYWTVTIHALGYADSSYEFQATADNIKHYVEPVTEETKAKLQATYDKAAALNEKDYTPESWAAFVTERDETKDLLAKENLGESEAAEQATHLQGAINALVSITSEYTFGYAALTWTEYWSGEGVQNGSSAASSEELDSRGETDRGAFDVVTRATTNHGVARGSFQCTSVFQTTDGTDIEVSHWTDGSTFVTPEGKTGTYSKGSISFEGKDYKMKDYYLTGLRYVPVMVKNSDLADFKATHEFVANGETLYVGQPGSTAEGNIHPYTAVAAVDANTNGIKTVKKSDDGFEISAAATGTGSGIQGEDAKVANFTPVVKKNTESQAGAFGEFLRVDFTDAGYGDLGANMQAVTWTYYGDDATRTTPQATFGTKFAADNWMHSKMGIQLGLTDSERCKLPAGTDGTGYWSLTIRALGYEDFTVDFEATKDNIVEPVPVDEATLADLQAVSDKANALHEGNYTAESWSAFVVERDETNDLLKSENLTKAAAKTQIEHLNAAIDALVRTAPAEGDYVLMNIPYDKFYAAETPNNSTDVDVFTSATKNKTRTGSLAGGSYHVNADGSDITGITFPVKVTKEAADAIDWSKLTQVTDDSSVSITVTNRGNTSTTDYTGKEALFESASYSFYALVSADAPVNYKELTVDEDGNLAFGAVEGEAGVTVNDDAAEFTTDSKYGDYELDLSSTLTAEGGALEGATVYGVVVNTADGTGYGMRHLENIWRTTELAWCTGFTDAVHNCPTSSEHYKSMMGKTIESVTYYTSKGTVVVTLGEQGIYVPVKTADAQVTAFDASIDNDSPAISANVVLPADFQAEYSIDGTVVTPDSIDAANNAVLFSAIGLKPGAHTLAVSDKSGKYARVSCTVNVTTAKTVAAFDSSKLQLVAADGVATDEFANYQGNIATVTVNGTAYRAAGKGAVKVLNDDGTLNVNAVDGQKNPIFGAYGTYTISVQATGYTTDLTFTYVKQADKATLNQAIESAKALDEEQYTTSSWAEFQKVVAAAEAVAENVEATDEEVAAAINSLTAGQAVLAERASSDTVSALYQQIQAGKNLKEADYTAKSWAAYQTALAAANEALTGAPDKTDAEVQAAADALKAAQDALVTPATDAQKQVLADQIAAGKDLKEADYTAESWAAYQAALTKANEVSADQDASGVEVEAAAKALKDAQAALEKAPAGAAAGTSTTPTSTNGTNGSTLATTGDAAPVAAMGFAAIGSAILAAASRMLRRRNQD